MLRDLRFAAASARFHHRHRPPSDTPEQWSYVFNNLDAGRGFTYQHTTVCFFGHTHVPMAFISRRQRHKTRQNRAASIEMSKKILH